AGGVRGGMEAKVDELAKRRDFETPPLVRLSSSTRSFIRMARELTKGRRVLEVPVHRPWSIANNGSRGKHVCPVTLVRPGEPSNNGSDRQQDVSTSAYNRTTRRRAVREENGGGTIRLRQRAGENARGARPTFSAGGDV